MAKPPSRSSSASCPFSETIGLRDGFVEPIGLTRVRKIEKILSSSIIDDDGDSSSGKIQKYESFYDQAIQLARAFFCISDPATRAEILTIVEAAAREGSGD